MLDSYLSANLTDKFNEFIIQHIYNKLDRETNLPNMLRLGFKNNTICERFESDCGNVESSNENKKP